ncbi:MAG: TonB-dependent receptor [Rudaea sp.]
MTAPCVASHVRVRRAATARRGSSTRIWLALLVWAVTGVATGQDRVANETDTPSLGAIEVIGSHIRGVDIETQHPVLVLDRAEILRTGLTSISDIIQSIVANGQTANRNINNGSNGEQLINLRSLGFNRTLVLLNGQRFVSDVNGAVDLSAIPTAIVERIEVLLDGASAIYGSDAIAGVINIITRRDFDGAELSAYYSQTDFDDGMRHAYDLSFGHKGDGWSVAAGIEYSRDDPIFAGRRAISATPLYGLPPGATGSGYTPYTWLERDSDYASCTDNCLLRLNAGAAGTSPADFRPVDTTQDLYNYQPRNYLQTPQERRALFAQARYEFNASLAVNLDVLFNQRHSGQKLAPSDLSLDIGDIGSSDAFAIAADNVYNPFGEPIDAAIRRIVEAGPRISQQTADTLRVHAGLDGNFAIGARDFSWSANASLTRSNETEHTGPYADNSRLALAVGPSFLDASGVARCGTPTAIVAGCVPLNFFGPPGSLTPTMLDYVDAFETNRENDQTRNADIHVTSTELFALPAGGLAFASGFEYRRESAAAIRDPLEISGNANGNGVTTDSTKGAYWVKEAYVEFEAPLLADQPFARKLDVSVGSRYSYYSNFGSTTNSQLGMRWKPFDDVLVRANYAQGFRAPAVSELFAGATRFRDNSISDPCDAALDPPPSAATLARCRTLGVPANVDSALQIGNIDFAGNPQLQPETSNSRGLGFVFTPGWLQGFDLSIDWYDVRLKAAIYDPGYQAVVSACYQRNSDADCAQIVRDSSNGTIYRVTDLLQNAPGGVETAGYDIALLYKRDLSLGRVSWRWNTNYVDYYGEIGRPRPGAALPDGSTAIGNIVGINSATTGLFGVVWRWRSSMQLAWERGPWTVSLAGRYFSRIDEDCSAVVQVAGQLNDPGYLKLCTSPDKPISIGGQLVPANRVGSVTFTDIEASWDAPWRGRFSVGVRNALNRSPPVAYSAFNNSFFPDYDLPGRFLYASYRQKF